MKTPVVVTKVAIMDVFRLPFRNAPADVNCFDKRGLLDTFGGLKSCGAIVDCITGNRMKQPHSADLPENAPFLRLFRRALIAALLLTLVFLLIGKHRGAPQQEASDFVSCPADGGCLA